MQLQNKKEHSHKRSNSLYEEPTPSKKSEQVAFFSHIQSELTMKLLEESQTKSQFQLIVDFLHPEINQNLASFTIQDVMTKKQKGQQIEEILNEYFQIQSISLMKKINQKVNKVFNSELDLEKLESEAKANSRLRYHRNKKSKVFNLLDLNADFSFSQLHTTWDQNYCSINSCAKA